MAQTFSNDLRSKFLHAYAKGEMGLERLAECFGVSYGWARKILQAQRQTGSTDRPQCRPRGFPSRLTPEIRQQLQVRIGQYPDATLVELQGWLMEQTQVAISVQRLSAVLLEMGLRRKKKSARR
jgi:transposase